jgi:hypothetical protein
MFRIRSDLLAYNVAMAACCGDYKPSSPWRVWYVATKFFAWEESVEVA